MNTTIRQVAYGPVISRLGDMMIHCERYASRYGVERLSLDADVSVRSVMRLIHEEGNPTYITVCRVVAALEKQLDRRIDPRDILIESGRFFTGFTCDLVPGHRGCLPAAAITRNGDVIPAFDGIAAGKWVTSRYPKGYAPKGGANEA